MIDDDGLNAFRGVCVGVVAGVAVWCVIALCIAGVTALLRG